MKKEPDELTEDPQGLTSSLDYLHCVIMCIISTVVCAGILAELSFQVKDLQTPYIGLQLFLPLTNNQLVYEALHSL